MRSIEYIKKYSKLVKVLRVFSQVFYWLSAAAVAILLPLAVYLSVSKNWFVGVSVPGNFRLGYTDGVIRYNLALAAGAVNPEQAGAILVRILFSIMVFAAVYGAISFFLSGVLKAVEKGEPFQSSNARRIFSIGLVFLGGSFFVGTAQASTADVIIHAMGLTEVLTVNYSANSVMIAAGLLMLIPSGIFRYGSYLQEEYDATL